MSVSFLLAGQRWYCSLMVVSSSYIRRECQPIIPMLRHSVTLFFDPGRQPSDGEAFIA